MSAPKLGLLRLPHGEGLQLPSYETKGAAGMDIRAALGAGKTITLSPGERQLVPTGFIFEIPHGFEMQVRPRSGLAIKHGVTCLNTPGTIDSDYRGEVKIILANLGQDLFTIDHGMRIAQLIVAPIVQADLFEIDQVSETDRGSGGFGSTGTD